MPYLEVTKSEEEEIVLQVDVPKITEKTLGEAKTILKEVGLEYESDTENQEAIITNQLPKEGIKVNQGTKVILYTN